MILGKENLLFQDFSGFSNDDYDSASCAPRNEAPP